jgi:Cu-Zn family superoxide dismutase
MIPEVEVLMRSTVAIRHVAGILVLAATPVFGEAAWAKPFATATLEAKSGSTVHGKVDFTETPDKGLKVRLEVTGLTAGPHGFHVHEKGDCSASDGSSAGAHYDPTADQHAGPKAPRRHLGDLGNVDGGEGTRTVEMTIAKPEPSEGWSWSDFVGKAIVIHAGADDFVTQPSGSSGDRIACGVIRPIAVPAE